MSRSAENRYVQGVQVDQQQLIAAFDAHQDMRGLSSATRKRRRWALQGMANTTDLTTARLLDIEMFVAGKRTAATRRAALCDLRAFYQWAARRDLVDADPTIYIDIPRVPKRQPTPIDKHNLQRAIQTADPRLRIALMLGALAGLRVSEIGALHSDDVWQPTHLIVRNGKGGKDRTVPLHPLLAGALERWHRGYIVDMTGRGVSAMIADHFKQLGIKHRPHDLRHTFGTECARVAKGDLVLVAGLMGHESIQTTQQYVGYRPEGAAVIAGLFAA